MKTLLFILLGFMPIAVWGQPRFVVCGTVAGTDSGTVVLVREDASRAGGPEDVIAKARITDGRFTIEGTVPDAPVVEFQVEGYPGTIPFFPEDGEYEAALGGIHDCGMLSEQYSRITGGHKQATYNRYREHADTFLIRIGQIQERYAEACDRDDTTEAETIAQEYQELIDTFLAWFDSFVVENPESDVPAYILYSEVSDICEDEPSLGKRFSLLGAGAQNSLYGKEVRAMLDGLASRLKAGDKFPLFPLLTADRGELTVADIDGKVKLVDFWSLGCGVCIAEMGELERLYERYHPRGLEIIHVYTWTDSPELWQTASERFPRPWIDAFESDPAKPLENSLSVLYLPFKVLLDHENTVLAVNPLPHQLEEILSQKLEQ